MSGNESWIYQVKLVNVTFPKNGKIPAKYLEFGQKIIILKDYID